jgi:CBS domain-containing protein
MDYASNESRRELLGLRLSHVLTCKEDSLMNVREVMSRDVKIASPEDTLQHAAELMVDFDAGVLPVGENDRLVGMLTDRDITVRAVAKGKAPDRTKVREVMSPEIKYIYEDESLEDAAENMGKLQIRRLPVLNREKRLVGIVSLGDLALKKKGKAGDALQGISQPA